MEHGSLATFLMEYNLQIYLLRESRIQHGRHIVGANARLYVHPNTYEFMNWGLKWSQAKQASLQECLHFLQTCPKATLVRHRCFLEAMLPSQESP